MKLSKINLEILKLYSEVEKILMYNADDDFDTRDNYIVSNIKVYDYLGTEDVITQLNKLGLNAQKDLILEEFTEDRLDSIANHTKEYGVECMKEEIEDIVHLNNYYEQARAYNTLYHYKGKNTLPYDLQHFGNDYYKKEFSKFYKRKNNSYKDYLKYLKKRDKRGFEELTHLLNIKREVWQFGRSGGWLSICEINEIENRYFDYNLTMLHDNMTNLDFNSILNYELDGALTKKELIYELKDFINSFNSTKKSIEFISSLIQESKNNYKYALIDRLITEILEFVDDLNITKSNVKVHISGTKVKTTLGISVDKDEFKINFNNIAPHLVGLNCGEIYNINKKVGAYLVERAIATDDDVIIKAGCHRFSFNNIKKVFNY